MKIKNLIKKYIKEPSIQIRALVSFSFVAAAIMLLIGVTLYGRFATRSKQMITQTSEQLLGQVASNLEDYLLSMRRISDAMYYDVIKDKDLAKNSLSTEINLLYEVNKDNLVGIALYDKDGKLITASPVMNEKENLDVTLQSWYTDAMQELENFHFSTPHVQNLFYDSSYKYSWVISLSRAVNLTDNGVPVMGVLLVDMDYLTIENMLNRINSETTEQYVYLCSGNGDIIFHPRQMQIMSGIITENNILEASYDDGIHEERFNGEKRTVIVNTVSYTGWKLINVIPAKTYSMGLLNMRLFAVMTILTAFLALLVVNRLVARGITRPIVKLNDSIKDVENGNLQPEVYIGGSYEIRHLGRTLKTNFEEIDKLMKTTVRQQEEKRKSELDALQSQINPHFLYNTLDSIVWMIEGEKNDEAVFMVTQLASLFRVSLSRGKTIISIEDEVKHARNYMNIQKVRYKNEFTVEFDIDKKINNYCTVKLIIQPILENAIYYGVEGMDGEGEINVRGYMKDEDIYLEVEDNGIGIPKEQIELIMKQDEKAKKRGSGVGIANVDKRIKLRFGDEYGIRIYSEPDEGTRVVMRIPAIEYNEHNQKLLEEGTDVREILSSRQVSEDNSMIKKENESGDGK
ncbi:MAG: sensor histidine kinase [Butyrivibrio sp.]|nr:sensor histidine kinase [Butyrivibrio sp.]